MVQKSGKLTSCMVVLSHYLDRSYNGVSWFYRRISEPSTLYEYKCRNPASQFTHKIQRTNNLHLFETDN